LLDESPGYAISVFWDDVRLFHRGEAATGLPESWTREGIIRTSLGSLWRVVHRPTRELAESHETPALTAVLWSGLAIAVLVGLLLFENGRAESRATAAESAERKLADLNRDLEQQIAERVRELADRSADLETITDSVAHDLRNPLNSISVNTQLLQQQFQDELGQEGLEALQRTSSSVKRMTEILDRLLGLSIVSHSIFGREEIDVCDIVREVFKELSSTEQSPPVELVAEELPKASADPVLVRTLIMNLLSNAIKYTREKPYRRIEVGSVTEDGVAVYCVRDNGIGFEPESAEKMFRAFERLDGNRETDGVGLGLDIAARVVRRHGGRIWAEGKRGEGAAIYFTLEADGGAPEAQPPAPS
jgi:signal transduction histidine kinase